MMKYSERVSGSHCSSTTGLAGRCRIWWDPQLGVSSGVGRTVTVAGVFGAGVLRAVFAGVF